MPPWLAERDIGHFSKILHFLEMTLRILSAGQTAARLGDPRRPPRLRWVKAGTFPAPDVVVARPKAWRLRRKETSIFTDELLPLIVGRGHSGYKWRASPFQPRTRASRCHLYPAAWPENGNSQKRSRRHAVPTARLDDDDETLDVRDTHWTDSDILIVYAPRQITGKGG